MSPTVGTRSRRAAALAAAVAVAVAVASACSVPVNEDPVELSGSIVPETTTSTSTTSLEAETREVVVYFLETKDGTTTLRRVPRSIEVGSGLQGVLSNLFSQPPRDDDADEQGLTTAIRESATLLSASRDPENEDRLIVDVRGLFGDQGIQGAELRNALAQIVWTATEGDPDLQVVFRQDGEPRQALVDDLESTAEAVDRDDYRRNS